MKPQITSYYFPALMFVLIGFGSCKVSEVHQKNKSEISTNDYIIQLSKQKSKQDHFRLAIISNISIVDVENGIIIPDKTVLLKGNIIYKILNSNDKIPGIFKHAILKIDGTGKYLAPGLCDMHVHYGCNNLDRLFYLSNGVTTIRNAEGTTIHLKEQKLLSKNKIIGPNLYTTSENFTWDHYSSNRLFLSRKRVYTKANWMYVRKLDSSKHEAYFSKVGELGINLSFDSYSIADSTIEFPENTVFDQFYKFGLLENQKNVNTFWFLIKDKGIYNSNTLGALFLNYIRTHNSQFCIGTESKSTFESTYFTPIHNYMNLLSDFQFPNADIIKMVTLNPGKMCSGNVGSKIPLKRRYKHSKLNKPFGIVREKYRADLLILNGNPLEKIDNYANINSLFVSGTYYSANDIQEMAKRVYMDQFYRQKI